MMQPNSSEAGSTELTLVLVVMLLLLVFGLAAVGIFYRVWRKERREVASVRRKED